MRYRYSVEVGLQKIKTKTRSAAMVAAAAVVAVAASLGLVTGLVGAAPGTVVYNNIPNPQPSNVPSYGNEAYSLKEFGSQVQFAGTERKDPTITFLLSSWACKAGSWYNKNCVTNPGSTFTHPMTISVYEANPDNSVGTLLASSTKTFTIPYRPTMDDGTNCKDATTGLPDGRWWDGTGCFNGKTATVSFSLPGVVLPDNAIVSIAYNTTHHGYAPIGESASCFSTPQGCPYDSLNVGTNATPTVGTSMPTLDDAYVNSTWAGFYCDSGASGTGIFRLDAGCWTGYLPTFKVEANKFSADECKGNGWKKYNHFKGQKDCEDFCKHNDHHDKDKNKHRSNFRVKSKNSYHGQ